ncbi:ABC transporter family protein [[Clostridium] sordellii ATCC 9714]|nr:ABC transporter family protein [[Clostridium] sordellii ATCC 9714] [Paeniclostridium sordellii ATCC 9714]
MKPGHIDTIDIDKFSDKLRNWDKEVVINNTYKNSEVLLELKNISFQYEKKKPILKDVSFKINKGEMVSIVGKNGAGKSTISKLICGFYKQTNGEIFLNNREITNDSIKERAEKIGIVMQNPNQMISKTMIFDEVALGLRFRGIDESEIKDRVYETLKVCGLYEYRNWPISALSYGQKKRVTIASILVLNPEIIILDEPTAGQDFKHYNEIMEFLLNLNKKGVTIIMITHDMHLMLEYTNRAIVLADGMKLADDTAANILTNKEVIKKANLKETSVYELAVKCRISDSRNFVNKFINYDRGIRRV